MISSNLERLLYDLCGEDSEILSGWMKDLAETGVYSVGDAVREKVQQLFYGGFCGDGSTFETIRSCGTLRATSATPTPPWRWTCTASTGRSPRRMLSPR